MSNKKYFLLIYPEESMFRFVLDCMRIIVDPTEKNFSHVTLKGPYFKRVEKILKKDNNQIEGKFLTAIGFGSFFNDSQNTVYLSCERTDELESLWRSKRRKSFSEFHPHLTIYNGPDREFAAALLTIFEKIQISIKFKVNSLTLYESKSSANSLFNLHSHMYFQRLNSYLGCQLDENSILTLSRKQRLELVEKLSNTLVELQNA